MYLRGLIIVGLLELLYEARDCFPYMIYRRNFEIFLLDLCFINYILIYINFGSILMKMCTNENCN